jgi:hypothetical protein
MYTGAIHTAYKLGRAVYHEEYTLPILKALTCVCCTGAAEEADEESAPETSAAACCVS